MQRSIYSLLLIISLFILPAATFIGGSSGGSSISGLTTGNLPVATSATELGDSGIVENKSSVESAIYATLSYAGINDLTAGGVYTDGAANPGATFDIQIDGTGTPNTFKWRKNGGAYTTGVNITGSTQSLSNGVTVIFGATVGHATDDHWTIFTARREELPGFIASRRAAVGSGAILNGTHFGARTQQSTFVVSENYGESAADAIYINGFNTAITLTPTSDNTTGVRHAGSTYLTIPGSVSADFGTLSGLDNFVDYNGSGTATEIFGAASGVGVGGGSLNRYLGILLRSVRMVGTLTGEKLFMLKHHMEISMT